MMKPLWIVTSLVFLLGAGTPSTSTKVDCAEPLDVANAIQGKCKKGELEHPCGCLTPPKITKKVDPYFPAAARGIGITGRVILHAVINTDGKVGNIEIMQVYPKKRGFEAAAIDAVKKWRYRPATLRGKAVPVSFTVNMDFQFR